MSYYLTMWKAKKVTQNNILQVGTVTEEQAKDLLRQSEEVFYDEDNRCLSEFFERENIQVENESYFIFTEDLFKKLKDFTSRWRLIDFVNQGSNGDYQLMCQYVLLKFLLELKIDFKSEMLIMKHEW